MAYSKKQFSQLARPHGKDGAAMLGRLNSVNANINSMALKMLGNTAGAKVLELGFGGGALIADGLVRFPQSTFYGAEISDLAVEQGRRTFAREIRENRVHLRHFDGQALPFPDLMIDTVIAVNVIYFISDIPEFLGQIGRVLKSGGTCLLGYAVGSPDRIKRFEKAMIEKELQTAGFDRIISNSARDDENGVFHCTLAHLRR